MSYIGLSEVLILGLVAYRLARALAVDKIGEPVRRWLYRSGAKRKLGSWGFALVSCPWCNSVWFSLLGVAWTTWLILPTWPGIGEFLIGWAAVSGVAALLLSADLSLKKWLDAEPKS